MLIEYSRTIAYICPRCGRLTRRDITLFDLPTTGASFYCDDKTCGVRVLNVTHKKDKYIFDALCTACDDSHRFTLKHSSFWKKQLLVFSCPQTLVDILFVGETEAVQGELRKQNELYMDAEEEIRATPAIGIYFEIIQIVNELAKRQRIICGSCKSKDFDIELNDCGIKITCRDCDSEAIVEISPESLEQLLETGTIVLE